MGRYILNTYRWLMSGRYGVHPEYMQMSMPGRYILNTYRVHSETYRDIRYTPHTTRPRVYALTFSKPLLFRVLRVLRVCQSRGLNTPCISHLHHCGDHSLYSSKLTPLREAGRKRPSLPYNHPIFIPYSYHFHPHPHPLPLLFAVVSRISRTPVFDCRRSTVEVRHPQAVTTTLSKPTAGRQPRPFIQSPH